MTRLRERKRAQYNYLVGEYFNLSQKMAEIILNEGEENAKESREYTQLNEELAEIEARIDDVVSEFEAEDFHLVLQQVVE